MHNIPLPIGIDNTPSLATSQRLTPLQMTTPPPLAQPEMVTNFSGSTGIPSERLDAEELKTMKFETDSDELEDPNLVMLEHEEFEVDNVNNAKLQIQISFSHK